MNAGLNHDADTDTMAAALRSASDRLETIEMTNTSLRDQFESEQWTGLDALAQVGAHLDSVRDGLRDVAEKIGVGGAVIRAARADNHMVGTRDSVMGR